MGTIIIIVVLVIAAVVFDLLIEGANRTSGRGKGQF